MTGRFLLPWFCLSLLCLPGCQSLEDFETRPAGVNVLDAATLRQARQGQVDFVTHVKPIMEAKCAVCHNQDALPGRMSLASQEEARRSGTLRAFIIPGQPEASPLLTRIASAHAAVKAMPPVGESLTQEETALLKRWIAQGAPWPPGPAGVLKTSLP